MIICDVFSLPVLTFLLFSRVRKPILYTSTSSSYLAGLICFTKFCDNFKIPEQDRMPTSKFLLLMFITIHGSGTVGNSAMKMWLEGLRLWHTINDAPWHGFTPTALHNQSMLHIYLPYLKFHHLTSTQGASKVAPPTTHQSKRDQVTIDHIKAL